MSRHKFTIIITITHLLQVVFRSQRGWSGCALQCGAPCWRWCQKHQVFRIIIIMMIMSITTTWRWCQDYEKPWWHWKLYLLFRKMVLQTFALNCPLFLAFQSKPTNSSRPGHKFHLIHDARPWVWLCFHASATFLKSSHPRAKPGWSISFGGTDLSSNHCSWLIPINFTANPFQLVV